MPYHNPATWLINEILSSTILNQVRDNLRYLKGLDEPVVFSNAIRPPDLTTAQRNALTAVNGMIIRNSSANRLETYEGQWGGIGVSVEFQRFTSSGTWSKPADINWVYAMLIGGGGGGVRGSTRTLGGAPGRLSAVLFRASQLPDNVTVTVGTGGVGAVVNVDGTSGGNSAFGDFATPGGLSSIRLQATNSLILARYLSQPGAGGSNDDRNAGGVDEGIAGYGFATNTPAGENDGANGALPKTGSGGGGRTVSQGHAGHGGAPGGGGGTTMAGSSSEGGNGGRGEVAVWSW